MLIRGLPLVVITVATMTTGAFAAPSASKALAPAAVRALRARNGRLHVVWDAGGGGRVAALTGLREPTEGATPAERATAFLHHWPALVGVEAVALEVRTVRQSRGRRVVVFGQIYDGVPVRRRAVAVTLDDAGYVRAVTNDVARLLSVDGATLGAARARELAERATSTTAIGARRVVVATGAHGVVAFEVTVVRGGPLDSYVVLVNAHNGRVFGVEKAGVH